MSDISRSFLVGCGRSGTTLLQALLGSHPKIVTFPETRWFETNLGEMERRMFGRDLRSAERPVWFLLARIRCTLGLARPEARRHWKTVAASLGLRRRAARLPYLGLWLGPNLRHFVRCADAFARQQEACVWLEKTPNHVNYLDVITEVMPDARCIHIVRRGTDVVASMVHAARRYPGSHWEAFLEPAQAAERWNKALRVTLSLANLPGHLVVRYEALVNGPERTLARAFDFLGLPDHPDARSEYSSTVPRIMQSEETWKQATARGISNRNDTRFPGLFSSRERAAIRSMLLYEGEPPL